MANKLYEENSVRNIAVAIRSKNKTTNKYKISEMAQAILDIPVGGDLQEKSVVYTKDETESIIPDAAYTGLSKVNVTVDVLSYNIITGDKPDVAPANTIWLNTNVINNHTFSASEPSTPAANDVWFLTGTPSSIAINILNTNAVIVNIISAQQYNGTSWSKADGAISIAGAWVDLSVLAFPRTFEWTTTKIYNDAAYTLGDVNITNASATLSASYQKGAGIRPVDYFDFTNIKTVRVFFTLGQVVSGNYAFMVYVDTTPQAINPAKTVTVTAADFNNGYVDVDVTAISGNYYILAGLTNWTRNTTVTGAISKIVFI